MVSDNSFRSLKVEGWRQFGRVDLDLHPRLTVITGANGAGKSSLLRLFSRHFGFDRPFLSTPTRSSSGGYTYLTGLFTGSLSKLWKSLFSNQRQQTNQVGTLIYGNGQQVALDVPEQAGVQYHVSMNAQQHVAGIHIDSHQPISVFQQVGQIPTTFITTFAAYQSYNNELLSRYQGGHTGYSPTYRMKEALIAMAMFGEGNSQVEGNPEILSAYRGFVEALRKVLPDTLGFIDISVRPPEVVLMTRSGEFLIDAASGGVMTLIDLTWRLHMFSLNNDSFVVTMDEPENHLHPTMQRTLMRRLLRAFPNAQFIIATHSPFMVSSVQDSNVYVLRYVNQESGKIEDEQVMPSHTSRVISERLDTVNKAGNASEILRDVLGVSATIPEWVEEGLDQVVSRYRNTEISVETLKSLRAELSSLGYGELYPTALAAITEGK
ncbi:AAA family ATPase [Agrobacterium cavarae]